MNWEFIFLACFIFGLVLSVLSFAGGFGHLHLGHLHIGHSHGAHVRSGGVSPFNGFTVLAFLCWFGGIGYVLVRTHLFAIPVTLALALLAGLAGAGAIFAFLVKVLLPHERELLPEDTEMRGVIGRINSALRPGATGEIHFSMNGTRRSTAARTEQGEPIPPHSQVVVVRYERGIAYVRPFADPDEWNPPQSPT